MIQSSTSPCFTTMSGTGEEGSKGTGVLPSMVMKNNVGLFGSAGSARRSEKYSLRSRTGATEPIQGSAGAAKGSAAAGSRERGSGARADASTDASARFGSFSPSWPVLTVRVISTPFTPSAGPSTMNSTRLPGGTAM